MAPKAPRAKLPGQRAKPTKRQAAPTAKHPWEKGYKVAKGVASKLNPFD